MSTGRAEWARRYKTALRKYVRLGSEASLRPAHDGLGCEAAALGLETLDLARIHTQALTTVVPQGGSSVSRQRMIERANNFFVEIIVPIEKMHPAARKDNVRVNRLTQALRRRATESAVSTRCLQRSVLLRQGAEQALRKSGERHARLLAELHRLQKQSRDLTHACLSKQEDERQRMSLHLQDEIAQALIAIDLRLLTLKKAAKGNAASLKKEIASTQRFMRESTKRIGESAHELGLWHEK